MTKHKVSSAAPFGTIIGHAPGGVPVYSSDYDSVDEAQMPDRAAFRSADGPLFLGYKWQCVEFARRWMFHVKGYVFEDVAMAYDIFRLRHVRRFDTGELLPFEAFGNGSKRSPEPGALMIWNEGGEFEHTGHVAVVTAVTADGVQVAEQNVHHEPWAPGADYARVLPMSLSSDGGYFVHCTFEDSDILVWMIQTDDPRHAEPDPASEKRLLKILGRSVNPRDGAWLDTRQPDAGAFVDYMQGHRLATADDDPGRYFLISDTARTQLKHASNQLHAMFMHATDKVLEDDALLARFNLPEALWPRLRQSWRNRRTHNITGRFDFAPTPDGLKLYEYNADSAGCYLECGLAQGAWARHHGVAEGTDAGARLFPALVDAWKASQIPGLLHILRDDDPEEAYHAHFIASAAKKAGLRCKMLVGLDGLDWDDQGRVVDHEGEPIKWVWKSWAWETALDELRQNCVDEAAFLSSGGRAARSDRPRLIDILLRPKVMVFEPLWSLIPSNKAILPVLWSLYPDHPNLLESHFELTGSLATQGYVRKPIVGRCGGNITLVDAERGVIAETDGLFRDRDVIYQALFPLPTVDDLRVQICTFAVDGVEAGACVRCDRLLIIRSDSDLLPLRVVPDGAFQARLTD